MIQVTLNFNSVEDMLKVFAKAPTPADKAADKVVAELVAAINKPVAAPAAEASATVEGAASAAAPKRTRGPNKPKATEPDPDATRALNAEERAEVQRVLAAAAAAPDTKATDAKAPTQDDVRAAFSKVNEKHGANGLAKVSEMVQKFGVLRISELKEAQYAAVIAACEAEVAA